MIELDAVDSLTSASISPNNSRSITASFAKPHGYKGEWSKAEKLRYTKTYNFTDGKHFSEGHCMPLPASQKTCHYSSHGGSTMTLHESNESTWLEASFQGHYFKRELNYSNHGANKKWKFVTEGLLASRGWNYNGTVYCVTAALHQPTTNTCDATDLADDWGELFDGVTRTTIWAWDLQTDRLFSFEAPEEFDACQAVALNSSDEITIVYTAYTNKPRRLGLAYCWNRRSQLFKYVNGQHEAIVTDTMFPRSPIPSWDGSKIAFLAVVDSKPHASPSKLYIHDLTGKEVKEDIQFCVRSEVIPLQPWNDSIVLNDIFGNQLRVVSFDFKRNESTVLFPWQKDDLINSYSALFCSAHGMLVKRSSPKCPWSLILYSQEQSFEVASASNVTTFKDVNVKSHEEYIYIQPKEQNNLPLIVYLHGIAFSKNIIS